MSLGSTMPFAIILVVVVVVGVGPSLAAPPRSDSLTHKELMLSIVINQMAILKGMNESSSTSHGGELNQLREDVEEGWRAMNETVMEGMNDIREISDKVQRWMTEMDEKRMNDTRRVMEELEAVKNTATVHHQRPDEDDLYTLHNDTSSSLCDGNKVLYGGQGVIQVTSSGNYSNNLDCSWTVTLPEGSRPVFRWYYMDIQECSPCRSCDYMYIRDYDHTLGYNYCGNDEPDGSFLTVVNNKFKVWFRSDGEVTGRGFRLRYQAVSRD